MYIPDQERKFRTQLGRKEAALQIIFEIQPPIKINAVQALKLANGSLQHLCFKGVIAITLYHLLVENGICLSLVNLL